MSRLSIGVAIITHRAKKELPRSLPFYLSSPLKPRILVVNSSSQDGTVELAQRMGAETLVVPRNEFNHGTTRERARNYLATDIVVMATPDAYPVDCHVLEKLVKPLVASQASISYARQIPHEGAKFFESFSRLFNYPEKGHLRSLQDVKKWGVYTFFCSNSCAAYLNSALDEIGGFSPVLLGEDTLATMKLLSKGHKVAYMAEALVRHSHRYTLLQEFRRNFDTGLTRRNYQEWLTLAGGDKKRGALYVREMVKILLKKAPYLLPYAFLQSFVKGLGYFLGSHLGKAPRWLKRMLSGQDFYWATKFNSFE